MTTDPDILRCKELVAGFFVDEPHKTKLWFSSPNPLLGNITPNAMIALGRTKKLLKFIENQLAENTCNHAVTFDSLPMVCAKCGAELNHQ